MTLAVPPHPPSLPADVCAAVAIVAGVEHVRQGDRLVEDLNLDSVRFVELVVELDGRFGVDLGRWIAEGRTFQTIRDLVDAIAGAHAETAAAATRALPTSRAEPVFVPSGDGQIYGLLQGPLTGIELRGAVLICPPLFHGHWQSRLALRALATRLASAGFATLRIDFRGQGDSSGDLVDHGPAAWTADVAAGVRCLKDCAATERVTVLGLDAGATLGLLGASELTDSFVLWNPVASGRDFLQRLELAHARAHGSAAAALRQSGELLGERSAPAFEEALCELSLPAPSAAAPDARIHGLDAGWDPGAREWASAITDRSGGTWVPLDEDWDPADARAKCYWPPGSVEQVAARVEECAG